MRQTICFVPLHASHLRKNRLLLRHLAEKNCEIKVLCVDALYSSAYATREQLEADGYSFRCLEGGRFDLDVHWVFQVLMRRRLAGSVRKLLREINPSVLLVCTDSDIPARTIIRAARALGVPSILLVDGLAAGRNPDYRLRFLPRLKVFIATMVFRMLDAGGPRGTSGVDQILVMNETSRENIIGHGVDKRRVKVVGSPEYDDLARRERDVDAPERNRRLRARIGISEERPVVLFAHQSLFLPRWREQDFIRQLMHAVRACKGILVVKFHPRCKEEPTEWRAWAKQEGFAAAELVFVRDWSPSIEAVRMCAACVTVYSTVAVEALVLGTPLILIQYLNTESILPYAEKYGAAIAVRSPAKLRGAIVQAMTDTETRAMLRRNSQVALVDELGGFDGRSLERTSKVVFDLLRHANSDSSRSKSGHGHHTPGL